MKKPTTQKPETVAQAFAFLQGIGAIAPTKRWDSGNEWATPKHALVFQIAPQAMQAGRPVADGFAQLAAQQYIAEHCPASRATIHFGGVGAVISEPGAFAPLERGETPGLMLCRALWAYLYAHGK